MAAFEELTFSIESFTGTVRVFPLPNLVLFPHVMQPLHIFEPRYRAMLEDALAGDRLITMALLAPGWERDYEGRPLWYPAACLGCVTTSCRLADGTYNLLLLGLKRVKLLGELAPRSAFREAKVEICEDVYPLQESPCHAALQRRLREALLQIVPSLPEVGEQLDQLLDGDVPLGLLTDVLGYMVDIPLERKHALLAETNVYRRAEMLLEQIASLPGNRAYGRFPPLFSSN
ncbi:MAG: LON peptidase substrate-binding domain-containing protein [Pirellulales bacterium]|nr:LON peptidase substrate-binding domain-containing protein [Pirellulales bacterium]